MWSVDPTTLTLFASAPQQEEAIALSWPLNVSDRPGRLRKPRVYFDIWFSPRRDPTAVMAFTSAGFRPLSEDDHYLPASSHCVLTEMDITCPILRTSFIIKVERPQGIRCVDVFQGIFNAYDARLTAEEQRRFASEIDERCWRAFRQRCQDAPHLPEVNQRQGMRRVDLLRGVRIYDGLTRDARSQTWVLKFHHPRE